MSFTNLFTTLSAIREDVDSPGETAFTHRNQSENYKRSSVRKRKAQEEKSGPHKQKRCYQEQKLDTYNAASFEYHDFKAMHCHLQNTDSENASISITKAGMHKHNDKAGHTGQTKRNCNVNKQQQQKQKTEGQKNHHHLKDKWKNTNRGGRHQERQNSRKGGGDQKHKNGKQDVQVTLTRSMTQEFKDQNALLVEDRLLCRHFLWGRCIKGDECQLEHIQGYNDLIKEVCKFYIQGFCSKGESCPYMHRSFPCKFFHRKGKCSQGGDCRFSHEPLNEATTRLLDEALKRENDLYQLAKKAEQDSSARPAKTDESEITDINTTSDILIQPPRPNFYNSEQTNAEQKALLCQAEEVSNDMEETYPPQTQPHSPPSTEPIREEPVCYSVEAVMGRHHFKPFPSFIATPQGQESVSIPVTGTSECTVNQSEVPYSVDAVLRSYKSVESFTLGHTPTPPAAQTVSYTSKTECEQVTDVLLSSEVENNKVSCSVSSRNQTSKSLEKMVKSLSSHQVHTDLMSKTCSDLTLVCGDHKKQGGEIPESLKPVPSVSHEVKLKSFHSPVLMAEKSSQSKGNMTGRTHLPTDGTHSINTKSESVLPFEPSNCKSLTSTPKHQLKPNVSGLWFAPQVSIKSWCPSIGFSEFKCGVAVSAEPVNSCDETVDSGNSVSQSAHCTSKDIHFKTAAEPDKASARSFLSLFATSPFADPLPCQSPPHDSRTASCSQDLNQSVDDVSDLSDPKQRASDLETPLQCRVQIDKRRTYHCQSTPKLSTNPKSEHAKSVNQPTEQQVNPACVPPHSLSEMSSSPPTQSHRPPTQSQQPSKTSANSVLRTLFARLSPYRQDGEEQDGIQTSVPSESEKNHNNSECVFVKKKQKSKRKGRRKKKMKTCNAHQQCSKTPAAQSTKHQPSFQTHQISSEATSGLTLCGPAMSELQVRNSGTHNSPLEAVTPLMQHHTRPQLKCTSEEGKCVNGNMAVTPLKDLFKTLDTTVFHFGH